MDFYTITTIIALILLIIILIIYGVNYNNMKIKPFPETQAICPKNWNGDISGNCINPTDSSYNRMSIIPTITPGYMSNGRGFNPNHANWTSYKGAKNSICGKKRWANDNNIMWDGVSNYNSC